MPGPGCKCCGKSPPPPCTTGVFVQLSGCQTQCNGGFPPLSTASLVLTDADGNVVSKTSAAIPDGNFFLFFLPAPAPGVYTISGTVPGYTLLPWQVEVVALCTTTGASFQPPSFCVDGCFYPSGQFGSQSLKGATVTLDAPGASITQTTDANGFTCFPVLYGGGTSPFTVTSPGYTTVSRTSFVRESTTVIMQPAPGFACVGCMGPVPATLHASTPYGDVILAAQVLSGTASNTYYGGVTYDYPGGCNCPPLAGIQIGFQLILSNSLTGTVGALYVYYGEAPNPNQPPRWCPGGGFVFILDPAPNPIFALQSAGLVGTLCPSDGPVHLTGVLVDNDNNGTQCLGGGPVTVTQ